jgi:hypothetical protein
MADKFAHILSIPMLSFLHQLGLTFFKEANIYFVYASNLDICGYGLTEIEAEYSFMETLEEFLNYTKKNKTLEMELRRLGWEKQPTTIPTFYHPTTSALFEPFNTRIFNNN